MHSVDILNESFNSKNDRLEKLKDKFCNDRDLFELICLIEEKNILSKLYTEENLVDLGERRAYNKIKMDIFKK